MKMSFEFASNLMDILAGVWVSANGIPSTEEEVKKAESYARKTFIEICNHWEKQKSKKWEITKKYLN